MSIRYTVTTKTRRCLHCGGILTQETHGEETPILASLWFITFPIMVPYWLINFIGFDCPTIPKIGSPVSKCPRCFAPYFTGMCEVSALKGEALLNYRFRNWFTVSYILGAILSFDLLYLLIAAQPIISIGGLVALLALSGVITIIIVYRLKLADIQSANRPVSIVTPSVTQENKHHTSQDKHFYCRKCGNQLPSDSLFCDKCGTKVVK